MSRRNRPRGSRPDVGKGLQVYKPTNAFEGYARAACFSIARGKNTQMAYWSDFMRWTEFCRERGVDPADPPDEAVPAWIEDMTVRDVAPKTRARRIAGLCSIFRRLRRTRGDGRQSAVKRNPFSLEEGPERETVNAIEPTPVASPRDIQSIIATCDGSVLGLRDAALLRILWATGGRRSSVIGMTFERIRRERTDYVVRFVVKGNKEVRALIRGKAAAAFTAWLDVLKDAKLTTGPIWRTKKGALTEKGLWHMVRRRARRAKIETAISPHMFRVAFLTYNPAPIESKQDAAGHADINTTRGYDRTSWRGREAFERMPEVEDTEE